MNNNRNGINGGDLVAIVIFALAMIWIFGLGGAQKLREWAGTASTQAVPVQNAPIYPAPARNIPAQTYPEYPAQPTALPADPQSDAVATAAQVNVGGVPPLPPPLYIDPNLHNGDAVAATADASTHQIYAWDIQRSQAHVTNYFNILDAAKQAGDNEAIRACKNLISLDLSNIENNKSFLPPGAVPGLDEYIAKTRERLASY